jgi:peroxiredoxin Q/BCP
VLGASFDTAEDNRRFATEEDFPYPLLCDVDRRLGLAYRACASVNEDYPRRITYVIGADGRIEQALATKDPGGQADAILATL